MRYQSISENREHVYFNLVRDATVGMQPLYQPIFAFSFALFACVLCLILDNIGIALPTSREQMGLLKTRMYIEIKGKKGTVRVFKDICQR